MSNEPNEAEKKLAEEITKTIGLMYWKGKTKNEDVVNAIAPILAAHRAADDSELVKALEELVFDLGAHACARCRAHDEFALHGEHLVHNLGGLDHGSFVACDAALARHEGRNG